VDALLLHFRCPGGSFPGPRGRCHRPGSFRGRPKHLQDDFCTQLLPRGFAGRRVICQIQPPRAFGWISSPPTRAPRRPCWKSPPSWWSLSRSACCYLRRTGSSAGGWDRHRLGICNRLSYAVWVALIRLQAMRGIPSAVRIVDAEGSIWLLAESSSASSLGQ